MVLYYICKKQQKTKKKIFTFLMMAGLVNGLNAQTITSANFPVTGEVWL